MKSFGLCEPQMFFLKDKGKNLYILHKVVMKIHLKSSL